mmetsp:Transcript_62716/g.99597  ORF Transcript_62716/g.99597 Transcript_62716/m.99597 type:complete len:115 (-) Transcript_62716:230-574(-)
MATFRSIRKLCLNTIGQNELALWKHSTCLLSTRSMILTNQMNRRHVKLLKRDDHDEAVDGYWQSADYSLPFHRINLHSETRGNSHADGNQVMLQFATLSSMAVVIGVLAISKAL